jgi:hypothetical protein
MIISTEDYYKYLAYIQSNNRPTIAILPSSEKVYNIDLKTRQIEAPEYLSVEHDHKSETVYFKVDRFFDYMDLSQTMCIVQYVTADNKARIYAVPFYDVTSYADEEKMLIPWCIDGGATTAAGTVQFSLRFYKVDEVGQQFIYNLNTSPSKSKVLYGMEVQDMNEDYDLEPTVYDEVLAKLNEFSQALGSFWEELY